nr:nucleotidyltransferase family protein [Halapricum sp. CBA1109]
MNPFQRRGETRVGAERETTSSTSEDPSGLDDGGAVDECQQWVLHRCRGDTSDVNGTAVPPTPPGEDWERAINFARRHRIDMLLFASIDRDTIGPASVREAVERMETNTKRQNLQMAAALIDIVDVLRDNDIPVITYKGPVVASRAYGDISLRRFVDLDVLVAPADRRQAIETLEAAGYERRKRYKHLSEVVLEHPETGTVIDLHTDAVPDDIPVSLPFGELYERRTRVDIGGQAVPALSLEDAVMVHAVHGSKHCWYRGEWLLAVTALIRQSKDLGALFGHLRANGCERMALCALIITHRLFGADYPESMYDVVERESSEWESATATAAQFTQWITRPEWVTDDRSHLEGLRAQLRLCPSVRTKVRFFLDTVTKPQEADREFVSLPDIVSPLYRIVRPVRLLYRYRESLNRG